MCSDPVSASDPFANGVPPVDTAEEPALCPGEPGYPIFGYGGSQTAFADPSGGSGDADLTRWHAGA